MVAAAVITARIMPRTVRGGIPGGMAKDKHQEYQPDHQLPYPGRSHPSGLRQRCKPVQPEVRSQIIAAPLYRRRSGHQSRIKHTALSAPPTATFSLAPSGQSPCLSSRLRPPVRSLPRTPAVDSGGDNSDAMLHVAAANVVIRSNAIHTVLS